MASRLAGVALGISTFLCSTLSNPLYAESYAHETFRGDSSGVQAAVAPWTAYVAGKSARLETQPSTGLIRLTSLVRGFGNVHFELHPPISGTWPVAVDDSSPSSTKAPRLLFVNGIGRLGSGERFPVAGVLMKRSEKPVFRLNFVAGRHEAGYQIEIDARTFLGRAHRRPTRAFGGRSCQLSADAVPREVRAMRKTAASTLTGRKIVTVATETDREWYLKFRGNSSVEAAALVNAADTIYAAQLGLRLKIVGQHVQSDASQVYGFSDSGALLKAFRDYTIARKNNLPDANVRHLFSGKDLDQNVIGLAYFKVVCRTPTASFGLTQFLDTSISFITTAHEIAHNLGAPHDPQAGFIMAPALQQPVPLTFSELSRTTISSFLDANGSCLANEKESPAPSPTVVPTAIPRATNTPRSKTGGDGRKLVQFTASLNAKGRFKAVIDTFASASVCTLKLFIGEDRNGGGVEVLSVPATDQRVRYAGTVRASTGEVPAVLYVRAQLDCGSEGLVSSPVRRVNPARVAAKKISRSEWIALLKQNARLR